MLKFPQRTIETNRLVLSPYNIKFYTDFFCLVEKNKLRLLDSFPKLLKATNTLENTKEYVQQKIYDWNNNRGYCFMIFNKSTQILIGHFNIKDIDWKTAQCELSYFIDKDFENNGLMSEAIQISLQLCFTALKLQHVFVRIVTTNIASQKVVEKAGLKYEGAFYQDYTTYDNQIVDTYKYGISKEDFDRNKTSTINSISLK